MYYVHQIRLGLLTNVGSFTVFTHKYSLNIRCYYQLLYMIIRRCLWFYVITYTRFT